MRPAGRHPTLGAAALGGKPAAPATAPAVDDPFDDWLKVEAAKLAALTGKAEAPNAEGAGAGAGEKPEAAPAKPVKPALPEIIVWAGMHGEQLPPQGIRWQHDGEFRDDTGRLIATSDMTPWVAAHHVQNRAWRLRPVASLDPVHYPTLARAFASHVGEQWAGCGGVLAVGDRALVAELLVYSVRHGGHPLVLPVKENEDIVDKEIQRPKLNRAARASYRRLWQARWDM